MLPIQLIIIAASFIWNISVCSTSGECYRNSNSAQFCQPNFINILHSATATATSTCGTKGYTENICNLLPSNDCLKCNSQLGNISRNTSLLFDYHSKGSETCWISGKIPESQKREVINVTISLDNLYEAYYITVEFCGALPDSIVLLKSIDYGQKWAPWHVFSSSCMKTFGMKRTSAGKMESEPPVQSLEPVCFSLPKQNESETLDYNVIVFNPMTGREVNARSSMASKQWMSLTSLRLMLIVDGLEEDNDNRVSHLGIADVAIGGRVQCYGHATQVKTVNDSVVCQCEHKTAGSRCDRCAMTHNDRPWTPGFATDSSVKQCQKCFCNNHATECTFDQEVYDKSKRIHGSRCLDCLHHTTGAQCESCLPGYFRDMSLPVNHTQVCQRCKCHIIGANTKKPCDPSTGNCACKDGVEGPTCNRCKKGYHQTSSSVKPCAADILKKMMATEERCEICGKQKQRIKFKKFCRQDIMIKVSIQSKQLIGDATRFGVRVETVWRLQSIVRSRANLHESDYAMYPIWVDNSHIRCKCPSLELGQEYLILTNLKQKLYLNQPELIVDRKSTVLKWRNSWQRRITKFADREKQGKCSQFKYRHRYSRIRYMNDG